MMIAPFPFAAAPASGAGLPGPAANDAAAAAFSLTLQSVAQSPESGLTAPVLAGAGAGPAPTAAPAVLDQSLLAVAADQAPAESGVALPALAAAPLAEEATPITLASPAEAAAAQPQARPSNPLVQAAEAEAVQPVHRQPNGKDAVLPAAEIPGPATPAAPTSPLTPLPAVSPVTPTAEPALETGSKKSGKATPAGQPTRTSVVKLAGDPGTEPAPEAVETPELVLAALATRNPAQVAPPTRTPSAEAPAVPTEALPAEALPAESLPAETLPAETLPAATLAAETLAADRVAEPVPVLATAERPVASARNQVDSSAPSEPTRSAADRSGPASFQAAANAGALASADTAATTIAPSEGAQFTLRADLPVSDAAAPDTHALPSQLIGQTITATAIRPVNVQQLYPTQTAAPAGTVNAQPGRIGREMGVEIARRVFSGQDEMLIRLNPQEMGRIEVRLSFDEGGAVRAVLASESPAALEMLRRETGDLVRSLADAGVRSDAQSFRFDRGGSESFGQRGQNGSGGQHGRQDGGPSYQSGADDEQDASAYRPLRTSGQVNLIA